MINSQMIFSMLGWFFSPLISIFINRIIDKRKDDKDRQRAYTEIAEKVEMLVINGINIDAQLINNMSHYISIKYRLKQPLKVQSILSRVNYEILSSVFVSKDLKIKILGELKRLTNNAVSKDDNQSEEIVFEKFKMERKNSQRRVLVSLLLAYFLVILISIILSLALSDRHELLFRTIIKDDRLSEIISLIGTIFAVLVTLFSLLIYNSDDKKRRK
ncbi:hypothetical protein [Limosilactobacillus reuteri]|uniref:hypothetical protein n=1 Tax=Limosilactobacillus reuteri TaxID=1598 RepID=UPI00031CE247|nr:hypothetical protein [Limosilactobacillus reuteri]